MMNKRKEVTCLDFKLYYKAKVTKITWYWLKNRHTDPYDSKSKGKNKQVRLYQTKMKRQPT